MIVSLFQPHLVKSPTTGAHRALWDTAVSLLDTSPILRYSLVAQPLVGLGGTQGKRSFGMNRALGLSFRPSSRSLCSLSGPNKLHIITLAFACPVSLLGALAVGTKSMTKKKKKRGWNWHKQKKAFPAQANNLCLLTKNDH